MPALVDSLLETEFGTDLEMAWLAGLLEGEGCFMFPPPSKPNSPAVVLGTTDEDVAERAAAIIGVSVGGPFTRPGKDWKPFYRVNPRGARAVALMRAIRDNMSTRRQEKIDEILDAYRYGA